MSLQPNDLPNFTHDMIISLSRAALISVKSSTCAMHPAIIALLVVVVVPTVVAVASPPIQLSELFRNLSPFIFIALLTAMMTAIGFAEWRRRNRQIAPMNVWTTGVRQTIPELHSI
ncbi:unnamed protein product [Caenorhabditis bovis]|uniref:Uncharacterized protein n=1 Tax=Caenorhabditis bovis TaxID=2654633 RepID=A0A8S1E4Z4_9PELO|nr:unnamed protein product [Caenorhabditis bovis]